MAPEIAGIERRQLVHQLAAPLDEDLLPHAERHRSLIGAGEQHAIVLQPPQDVRRAGAIAQRRRAFAKLAAHRRRQRLGDDGVAVLRLQVTPKRAQIRQRRARRNHDRLRANRPRPGDDVDVSCALARMRRTSVRSKIVAPRSVAAGEAQQARKGSIAKPRVRMAPPPSIEAFSRERGCGQPAVIEAGGATASYSRRSRLTASASRRATCSRSCGSRSHLMSSRLIAAAKSSDARRRPCHSVRAARSRALRPSSWNEASKSSRISPSDAAVRRHRADPPRSRPSSRPPRQTTTRRRSRSARHQR